MLPGQRRSKGASRRFRASKDGKGVDLTQRQAYALAGEWYRQFTSQHLDNPGSAKRWSNLRETLWDWRSWQAILRRATLTSMIQRC